MTDAELTQIESALDIHLPCYYREVMLNFPFTDQSWPDPEIINSAHYLIKNNCEIRTEASFGPQWKHQHFAFGHTNGGDTFALDTSLEQSPVILVDWDTNEFKNDAVTLADWIELRIKWYVNFDRVVERQKYESLIAAIESAGFFVAPIEPMGGWDRVCPVQKKRAGGGYSGISFWVSKLRSGWYLGTWGLIYRIHDQTRIVDCCIDRLRRAPEDGSFDFDTHSKNEYGLTCVSDEAFDNEIKTI